MPKAARDHKLDIDNTGRVADALDKNDTEPVFSVSKHHKATWFCAYQNWYVCFYEWPFKPNTWDRTFELKGLPSGDVHLYVIDVKQGKETQPKTIDKGRKDGKLQKFVYSLVSPNTKKLRLSAVGSHYMAMETGPEVLGED